VINAMHALVSADDAQAARSFFRDVVGWPNVDAHDGWLIFKTGPSELGVHPTSGKADGEEWSTTRRHEISLMCDDIEKTIAELKAKGAEFTGDLTQQSFGLIATMKVPGAGDMMLYQPRHQLAYDLEG
jgi:predicted enzyme related to lactoylglutathione lyase